MAEIKATAVPERRELVSADRTGETFVVIRPPSFYEEKIRGRLTSKREYVVDDDGYMNVTVDVNTRLLWAEEVWLTYVDTNLKIKLKTLNEDGEEEEVTIEFEPKEEMKRSEFMRRLEQVPPQVVWEWHAMVVDVVPEWRDPF